jgi:protein transport protein SEC23
MLGAPNVFFSWTKMPADEQHMHVPAGLMFTPLAPLDEPAIYEPPMRCGGCGACLCPGSGHSDDFKFWRCQFCNQMTPIQSMTGFAHASSNATAEYALEEVVEDRPLFVFVVDQCGDRARFAKMRDAVEAAMALMPTGADVGLITFCATTRVHDLSMPGHTLTVVVDPLAPPADIDAECVCASADVSSEIQTVLSRIEQTVPERQSLTEPKRCTGHALQTALRVIAGAKRTGAHLLLFVGGPCNHGDGKMADGLPRAWKDIHAGATTLHDDATDFYEHLAVLAIDSQTRVSVVSASQIDVGLMEMRPLVQCSGGVALMGVRFDDPALRGSLRALLEREFASGGRMVVQCTPNWRVEDALGPIARIDDDGTWLLNALDRTTTLALYLDVLPESGDSAMLQIVLKYVRHDGRRMVRVTTVRVPLAAARPGAPDLDPATALALIARRAVFKIRREPRVEVVHWLDKTLIGAWRAMNAPNEPYALLLAQGVYFLRRGRLMQDFGFSPDQTTYAHMHLMRETAAETVRMNSPMLELFLEDGTRNQTAPSAAALHVECARLFDDYFNVHVVCSPHTPTGGPAAGAALRAAHAIAAARFPVPELRLCSDGDSEARHMLAGITPSPLVGHALSEVGLFTEDATFEGFLEQLHSIACDPAQKI